MKNLKFRGAVAQLARAPALQAGCRGFEPLRLHFSRRYEYGEAARNAGSGNVPLRDVAVLRCRTLIEKSRKITGWEIW